MHLGNMATIVKIRCPSNRGDDSIVSKVMRRLLIENQKNQRVSTQSFVSIFYKSISQCCLISLFLLHKINQLESEIAKLQQKPCKFPCYPNIPHPFDPPDETDIIAVREIFNKVKQEVIDTEEMEARKYLTSNECSLFLDDLLWMFSKTVLQQII